MNEVLKIRCDPKIKVLKKGAFVATLSLSCTVYTIQYIKKLLVSDLNKNFLRASFSPKYMS